MSSEEFKAHGGVEEVIQLWLNLPTEFKMTEPNYVGLSKNEITHQPYHDQRRSERQRQADGGYSNYASSFVLPSEQGSRGKCLTTKLSIQYL
ncbi:MAG: hypothetical protein AAF632_01570 [Bacteroidota bacterium]